MWTFNWSVYRGCKAMSMYGEFQHVNFLATGTVINEV